MGKRLVQIGLVAGLAAALLASVPADAAKRKAKKAQPKAQIAKIYVHQDPLRPGVVIGVKLRKAADGALISIGPKGKLRSYVTSRYTGCKPTGRCKHWATVVAPKPSGCYHIRAVAWLGKGRVAGTKVIASGKDSFTKRLCLKGKKNRAAAVKPKKKATKKAKKAAKKRKRR